MISRIILVPILALALGVACASTPQVQRDYDPEYAFSNLETYAWMEQAGEARGQGGVRNPLIEERIRDAVDRTLAAKGYTKAESEPDFLVAYHASAQEKIDVSTTYDTYGYRWRVPVARTDVRQYTEGTLLVDIVDADRKELVWRGTATGAVRGGEPDEVSRRIDEAVQSVLADFPPQG